MLQKHCTQYYYSTSCQPTHTCQKFTSDSTFITIIFVNIQQPPLKEILN